MKTSIKITPIDIQQRKALGLHAGDSVRVSQKITEKEIDPKSKKEKEKTRIQVFDGLVLSVKHGAEAGGTFTVRKTVDGVGVERIFPLLSPMIEKIEITRRAKVRRSKLYHIREKAAKEIRRQMRTELVRKEINIPETAAVAEASAKETKEPEAAATEEVSS